MRAYVAMIDRLYEVEGREDDDGYLSVTSSPSSVLRGARIKPSKWSITKDAGFIALESELKENLRTWKSLVVKYKADHDDYNRKYAEEQIPLHEDLLRRTRLFDTSMIVRLEKK